VNSAARPRFEKGVRLRRDADGSSMLLVPEGALVLNAPAAAALELVDGTRSFEDIVTLVTTKFEVAGTQARDELSDLFDRLHERGFVR
jgi:hypothetical protein